MDFDFRQGCRPINKLQILLADRELDFVDIAQLPQYRHDPFKLKGRTAKCLDHLSLTLATPNNVTRVFAAPLSEHLPLHEELSFRAPPVAIH